MGKLSIDYEEHNTRKGNGLNGTIDATWKGNKFRNVNVKYPHKCLNCTEYTYNGQCDYYFRRNMICDVLDKRRTKIFSIITGLILSAITFYVLSFMHMNLVIKIFIIIASFVILDIISRFICGLNIHKKRMERKITKKLKKLLKDKEKGKININEDVITESEIKENETLESKIKQANRYIEELKQFRAESYEMSNNKEIQDCISRFDLVMSLIQEKKVRYYNAAEILEEYLPRVCNMLGYYTEFLMKNSENLISQKNEVITNLLHMFNNSLTDAKIKSIFSIESSEKQFDTIADEFASLVSKKKDTENNVEGNDNNAQ